MEKAIVKQAAKLPDKLKELQRKVAIELQQDEVTLLTDDELLVYLEREITKQQIQFVYGSGKRKHTLQRLFEECVIIRNKRIEYDEKLQLLGTRNSYSKTGPDATFMRLKEDHMLNGQLKPAYNVQLAVHSEYIVGVGVFPNPTDTKTLIPFMKQLESQYKQKFQYVVADAGYDSNENLSWLLARDYKTCIKPSNYERSKTKRYREDIGRADNITYDEMNDTFTCAKGRKLHFERIRRSKSKTGFVYESRVYRCKRCNYCGLRSRCQKTYYGMLPKSNKALYISTNYQAVLDKNNDTFNSPLGILLRMNRSIQVEGVFGVLKEDMMYKRLRHRGKDTVKRIFY